ncbi:hypothetical protein [Paraburkholderia sp.]|uniref:hypothetical protein n=1 Tax=Paraburkholderia sp. TaxID=1926495 RepID=UPI0039C9B387
MMKSERFDQRCSLPLRALTPRRAALLVLATLGAGVALMSGCTLDPPGPSPIYSRLPSGQSDLAASAPVLTPDERARYDAIDRQVLADQDRAMAAEAAAQTWPRAWAPPVTFYGSYYSGGWGYGLGTGVGYGYPGWGW